MYLCGVKRFRSLSKSLTYRIMAVVLVMMVIIAGVVYFTVRAYMLNEAQDRYLGLLLENHQEMRRKLSDVYVAVRNNIDDIENEFDQPEKLKLRLERILQVNPTIITCGILYQPDYFPGRKQGLEIIATHDSTGAIHLSRVENNIYLERRWFKECVANDSALWSEAYFENNLIPNVTGRRQLSSFCHPIHDKQGKVVAILCADLSLEKMRNDLMEDIQEINNQYEKGLKHKTHLFIVARDGTLVIHPDPQRILKKFDDSIGLAMMARRGTCLTEVDGVMSRLYYRSIPHTDWTMVIVTPKDVILSNAYMLNTIILMVMLAGLVAIYFISRQMIRKSIRPLRSLALSAEEVAKGNFSSVLPDVKGTDEVSMLRDSFDTMQISLTDYVDEIKRTTAEQTAIMNEMTNARDIQMAMVPNQFPPFPERSDIDIYGMMEPAKSVGGDLFDFLIRDNRLYFCIGDVSGKGIPAALLMAVTRSLFHSISMSEQQPEQIIWRINRGFCQGNINNMFVTMFIGILDLATGHLVYCNAGHEAPLLANQLLPVKRNKPVGVLLDWVFEAQETDMQPGDTLFLYTDGLNDARNQTGKRMGRARVAELASQFTHQTVRQLVQQMADEVHRYAAGTEQSDDITLLAIKWTGAASQLSISPTIDEIDRLKPFVTGAATQAGLSQKETKRLRAAVEEALANVINYSGATTIALKAEEADGQLIITIDDDGLPFDPTQDSATDLTIPADQRPPGGMGIHMMQRMTDGLSYQRHDGHNILKLFKNI